MEGAQSVPILIPEPYIWSIEKDKWINVYASKIGAPWYIKKMLTATKGEIDSNRIIVGDFNTSFTSIDRTFKQSIRKQKL